jgi:hypothetical protein
MYRCLKNHSDPDSSEWGRRVEEKVNSRRKIDDGEESLAGGAECA